MVLLIKPSGLMGYKFEEKGLRRQHIERKNVFRKNGQTAFLIGAVLVLLICYTDPNFMAEAPGSPLFPACGSELSYCGNPGIGIKFCVWLSGTRLLWSHAAFYGIGAYTTAVLLKYTNISFWITIPAGLLPGSSLYPFHWLWLPFVLRDSF